MNGKSISPAIPKLLESGSEATMPPAIAAFLRKLLRSILLLPLLIAFATTLASADPISLAAEVDARRPVFHGALSRQCSVSGRSICPVDTAASHVLETEPP